MITMQEAQLSLGWGGHMLVFEGQQMWT